MDRFVDSARTDRSALWKIVLGFAIAALLIYLLGAVIGWEETLGHLRAADPVWVGAACLSTVLCLATWGKTWQLVLGAVGVSVPYRKLVVTFFAATFANYVTPMGQAGGEPFIAYVLARDTDASYEQSLASVLMADLIRLLPFFTVGGIGLVYLLVSSRFTDSVEWFVAVLVAMTLAVPLATLLAWRNRERLRGVVLGLIEPIARRTDRLSIE